MHNLTTNLFLCDRSAAKINFDVFTKVCVRFALVSKCTELSESCALLLSKRARSLYTVQISIWCTSSFEFFAPM